MTHHAEIELTESGHNLAQQAVEGATAAAGELGGQLRHAARQAGQDASHLAELGERTVSAAKKTAAQVARRDRADRVEAAADKKAAAQLTKIDKKVQQGLLAQQHELSRLHDRMDHLVAEVRRLPKGGRGGGGLLLPLLLIGGGGYYLLRDKKTRDQLLERAQQLTRRLNPGARNNAKRPAAREAGEEPRPGANSGMANSGMANSGMSGREVVIEARSGAQKTVQGAQDEARGDLHEVGQNLADVRRDLDEKRNER